MTLTKRPSPYQKGDMPAGFEYLHDATLASEFADTFRQLFWRVPTALNCFLKFVASDTLALDLTMVLISGVP